MQAEDKIRLQHILDEAEQAIQFVEGYSFDLFFNDVKTVRALTRSIEIIGEAASKISKELKKRTEHIPWQKIVGMRNRLIHAYFDIDHETIWATSQDDLPALINMIKTLLEGSD